MKKILIILTLLLFTISTVSAENITINQTQSIQDAINNLNDGDTLYLEEGQYLQTGIEINKTITIEGLGENKNTIINGEYKNTSIFILSENITASFKNLKLINGNSTYRGGAITSYLSPVVVDNCIFEDNIAERFGGAIGVDTTTVSISNSIFINNIAYYDGGAISATRVPGSKVENSIFINNTAPEGWGGAFYNWYCGMIMNNVTITGSQAETAGAIFNSGNLKITNSKITNNHATTEGGAIFNYHNTVQVENTIITNNTAIHGSDVSLYRTEKETNFNNNWWGINNPENTTEYPINWTDRFLLDYDKTVNYPTEHLNLETELNDNILTINLKTKNNKTINLPIELKIETDTQNYTTTLNTNNTIKLEKTNTRQTIKTAADYQTIYNTLEAEETTTQTIINSTNLIKTYENQSPLKGTLTDTKGNKIAGQHISIKLTRTSNGANKIYNTVTNYNGEFTLPINLATGTYTATINYNGLNTSDKTYLPAEEKIQNITIIEGNTIININPYTGENLKGNLKTIENQVIPGQHLNIKLTRTSNGANKIYNTVTNYNGEFTLPINLATGTYSAEIEFNGYNNYTQTSAKINFEI